MDGRITVTAHVKTWFFKFAEVIAVFSFKCSADFSHTAGWTNQEFLKSFFFKYRRGVLLPSSVHIEIVVYQSSWKYFELLTVKPSMAHTDNGVSINVQFASYKLDV